jgi:hypothetical protein
MNTRRYPRTIMECHGMRDATYAQWCEVPDRSDRIVLRAGLFALACLLGMVWAGWV